MKVVFVLIGSLAATGASLAQGSWASVPNWPTSTIEAFAIHQCHLRPANPAMGSKGPLSLLGQDAHNAIEPWIGILRRH